MRIAIITARGGSKRIPRKNIRPFLGKPMLAWPLEAAQQSGCFDKIIVSTEDEEIADVARKHGALVPFMRPLDLADDFSRAHKAARHALEWAIQEWGAIDYFCHLYPAAPLLSPATIQEAMHAVTSGACKTAWGMVRIPHPVYQVIIKNEQGVMEQVFSEEKYIMRSQDMPPGYFGVGQLYAFETAYFLEHEMRIGEGLAAIEIPHETALDIDTEEDWLHAEKTARRLLQERN